MMGKQIFVLKFHFWTVPDVSSLLLCLSETHNVIYSIIVTHSYFRPFSTSLYPFVSRKYHGVLLLLVASALR